MAEEGQVIGIHSVDSWKQQLQKGKDSKKLIVVDFTASWCGPCRLIAPVLAELAKKTPEVIFLKLDVDEVRVTVRSDNLLLDCYFGQSENASAVPTKIGEYPSPSSTEAVSDEYKIEAMPTFLFLKEGKVVDKVVGANRVLLELTVRQHSAVAAA